MNYFIVASACLFIALIIGFGWSHRQYSLKLSRSQARLILWISVALVFIVYALLGTYKYYAMRYGLWDFGIYDSMLHNTAFGYGFMRDFRGPFDHFSPVILLLVPFYWIFDTPLILIFFQAAVMALAAVPLFLLARHCFRRPEIALLLACMYLLNPYYSRIVLYDFHIECLFPLLFFTAWLFYFRGKLLQCVLLLACAPLIKEDFIVPLGACGLFLCSSKKSFWHGVFCLIAAGFWSWWVLQVWFPHIMRVDYQHYGRFPPIFGNTVGETASNLLQFAKNALTRNTLAVTVSLLLPFAGLPLFSWRALLLLLAPTALIHFCSTFAHQQLLVSHYASALIAIVPVAAVFGARQLRVMLRQHHARRTVGIFWSAATALILITHLIFCDLPNVKFYNYITGYRPRFHGAILSVPLWNYQFVDIEHTMLFHAMRRELPPGLSITAQNNLGYFFLRTHRVYSFPGPKAGTDVYIFDTKTYTGYDTAGDFQRMQQFVGSLLRNPNYQLTFQRDGILIISRIDIKTS